MVFGSGARSIAEGDLLTGSDGAGSEDVRTREPLDVIHGIGGIRLAREDERHDGAEPEDTDYELLIDDGGHEMDSGFEEN
jgi:hypothetical protein